MVGDPCAVNWVGMYSWLCFSYSGSALSLVTKASQPDFTFQLWKAHGVGSVEEHLHMCAHSQAHRWGTTLVHSWLQSFCALHSWKRLQCGASLTILVCLHEEDALAPGTCTVVLLSVLHCFVHFPACLLVTWPLMHTGLMCLARLVSSNI